MKILIALGLLASILHAEEATYQFRFTSLFAPGRIADFHKVVDRMDGISVLAVDFDTAVATLRFDQPAVFPGGTKPEVLVKLVSRRFSHATRGVIQALPLTTVPPERLATATIPVAGLDCKGCAYAAYLAVAKVAGVDYATASFKTGKVVARFDRDQTDVSALTAALDKARVPTNFRLDDTGLVPTDDMTILRFSSEKAKTANHAQNAIDGDPQTHWESAANPHPHELIIDLGKRRQIAGFRYLARQFGNSGTFAETEFYVSDDPTSFDRPAAATFAFANTKCAQAVDCRQSVKGRYVMVRVLSEINGKSNATAAEIGVIETDKGAPGNERQ